MYVQDHGESRILLTGIGQHIPDFCFCDTKLSPGHYLSHGCHSQVSWLCSLHDLYICVYTYMYMCKYWRLEGTFQLLFTFYGTVREISCNGIKFQIRCLLFLILYLFFTE